MNVPAIIEAAYETIQQNPGRLDVDILHAMEDRDNALIADQLLHGSMSDAFVYNFEMDGKTVSGISVIGARHLAHHYGGLKHKLVSSIEKRGSMMVFKTYPHDGMPAAIHCQIVQELAGEPDFYECLVEITDIKTGNTKQEEKRELRYGKRKDGGTYERANYQNLAQSKAYRNAIKNLVPQDVQIEFKAQCLKVGKAVNVTENVMEAKRAGCIKYAAKHGIHVKREALTALTYQQIAGVRESVDISLEAFKSALAAVGALEGEFATAQLPPAPPPPPKQRPKKEAEPQARTEASPPPPAVPVAPPPPPPTVAPAAPSPAAPVQNATGFIPREGAELF